MSRFANDVAQYISGLEVGFEKAFDALRAIDGDENSIKYMQILVESILTTVHPKVIKGMSNAVQDWIEDIKNRKS